MHQEQFDRFGYAVLNLKFNDLCISCKLHTVHLISSRHIQHSSFTVRLRTRTRPPPTRAQIVAQPTTRLPTNQHTKACCINLTNTQDVHNARNAHRHCSESSLSKPTLTRSSGVMPGVDQWRRVLNKDGRLTLACCANNGFGTH